MCEGHERRRNLKVDIAQLENAQGRVTRLVPELRDRCYEDRLRALNLPSLLCMRRRTDMIQTFRIMNGIDDVEASDFFTINSRETRGRGMKLVTVVAFGRYEQFETSSATIKQELRPAV